jgi:ABC-type dipeptide/oligopeptide/nickel transport system permease component
VVAITAALALAIPRWAHPELYLDEQGWGGLADAMRRAFFHFDFGVACGWVGCPTVHDMWLRGYAADVWMLFGAVAIGVGAGFALGLWCAGRADWRRARVVERAAAVLYCTPAYVLGLGVLLLFHPTFGTLPLPYFFDPAPIRASPLSSPWDWFRSLLVPWLVAAAPLAAMCLRLVVVLLREQQGTDHVRMAIAKGVPHKRVIRDHAQLRDGVRTAAARSARPYSAAALGAAATGAPRMSRSTIPYASRERDNVSNLGGLGAQEG